MSNQSISSSHQPSPTTGGGLDASISPAPWKVLFTRDGMGKEMITINTGVLPGGGFYEVCREYIDGEPDEATERIRADFDLMASAPALASRVAELEAALGKFVKAMDKRDCILSLDPETDKPLPFDEGDVYAELDAAAIEARKVLRGTK